MARSRYIYVFHYPRQAEPLMLCFTVKHELLRTCAPYKAAVEEDVAWVERHYDGGQRMAGRWGGPVKMAYEDLWGT